MKRFFFVIETESMQFCYGTLYCIYHQHDDVIKWKRFRRYWPFVRGIHRSPVISPHKGQWSGALMFPLICAWINGWANNREVGDLRRHRTHYDVTVMEVGTNMMVFFPLRFKGSMNLYTGEAILNTFMKNVESSSGGNERHVLVFYCEFSSQRGPAMARYLRQMDRAANVRRYPNLHYPEIYLLHNGYKEIFAEHKVG